MIRKSSEKLVKSENIVGMEAHLWGELVRDITMVQYLLFPRLIAFAERAWHQVGCSCVCESFVRRDTRGGLVRVDSHANLIKTRLRKCCSPF